jgi:hypothetical protein
VHDIWVCQKATRAQREREGQREAERGNAGTEEHVGDDGWMNVEIGGLVKYGWVVGGEGLTQAKYTSFPWEYPPPHPPSLLATVYFFCFVFFLFLSNLI